MNLLILLAALLIQDKPFPDADPKPAIEAAKKKAAAENRRVLVLIGNNDVESSLAVASMLKKDKELARLILYEYDLVLADAEKMSKSSPSLPFVCILDPGGKELHVSTAPPTAREMVELLKKHQATPWIAKDVLAAAMKKAAEEKKRVLLTFGAPW